MGRPSYFRRLNEFTSVDPIRHRRSRDGVRGIWRRLQLSLYSPRVLGGLPNYATMVAEAFWETDAGQVLTAMQKGDVAFFIACLVRIDQIDRAAIDAGRTIADRAPLATARWLVEGFRMAAERRLREVGGVWPPSPDVPVAKESEGKLGTSH